MDASTKVAKTRILYLLEDLPPESVKVVEQFVQFLHERAQQGHPVVAGNPPENGAPYLFPTVAVPPASLNQWLNLPSAGYEGDALQDTESTYDEA